MDAVRRSMLRTIDRTILVGLNAGKVFGFLGSGRDSIGIVDDPARPSVNFRDLAAEGWTAAWNSHDVDRILTYYTDDAVYEDVAIVENGWDVILRGHDMIRESLVRTFADMPDLKFELASASAAGDQMVFEWIMTGTRYRDFTGRFSIRAVSVIELEGDKIASVRDYYDTYLLLQQLGVVPALDAE